MGEAPGHVFVQIAGEGVLHTWDQRAELGAPDHGEVVEASYVSDHRSTLPHWLDALLGRRSNRTVGLVLSAAVAIFLLTLGGLHSVRAERFGAAVLPAVVVSVAVGRGESESCPKFMANPPLIPLARGGPTPTGLRRLESGGSLRSAHVSLSDFEAVCLETPRPSRFRRRQVGCRN